jgi:hypothetical protein
VKRRSGFFACRDELLDDIMWSGWDDDTGEPPVKARDLYRRLLGLAPNGRTPQMWV